MSRLVLRIAKLLPPLALLVAVVGVAIALYARYVEPYRPRLTQAVVPLPRRFSHLDGVSIAFVSDQHIGPHFRASDLKPVIEALKAAQPDVILFGGDYASESPRFIAESAESVREMVPLARYGAYGIIGNHDLSLGRERVVETLEATGLRVLQNEAAKISLPQGEVWIAGIDDCLLGRPDLEATFRQTPADAAVIAMWHEPDLAAEVAPFMPLFLLAGHTHGGQVRLPKYGPVSLPKRGRTYAMGHYMVDDMPLYVTAGLGVYRPPLRFNCPPEVLFLRLLG